MEIIDLQDFPAAIPILAKWHQEEWSDLTPSLTLEGRMEKMQAYLTSEIIPSTYIAMENNQILGSAALVENDMDTKKELSPWLASVYVDKVHRGKGIGSKLVLHAMEAAKNHGIDTLYLFTPNSEGFYKRLGWSAFSTEMYHGQKVVVMEKRFDGAPAG